MISVIICSRYPFLSEKLLNNIAETIHVEHEIIHIDNSENKYSIFEAYNKGFRQSKYPYLCFVHEDVLFRSENWGCNLMLHLQNPAVGIVGLAGRDYVPRIPGAWTATLSSVNIIQSDSTGKKQSKQRLLPKNFNQTKREVILLDGVLLCMRSDLFKVISFDEKIGGFHGYDFDISIQSTLAGYINYVVYDILLEHFSRGKPDFSYFLNLICIFKKWQNKLPLVASQMSDIQRVNLFKIERNGIVRLSNKLVRRGFSKEYVLKEVGFFAKSIGVERSDFLLSTLAFRIFLVRLLNCPGYFLKRTKSNQL